MGGYFIATTITRLGPSAVFVSDLAGRPVLHAHPASAMAMNENMVASPREAAFTFVVMP
ncbi:MAG: hypothetical protein QM636_16040 [Rhizobium sp.]